MSLESRLRKVEGRSGGKRGSEPHAVYLCELQTDEEETKEGGEPRLAYIMKGPNAGSQTSREEDETRAEFESRVQRLVEGLG